MRNKSFLKTLGFECLENRQLLAGDVRISLSGGDLRIAGDSGGNVISIESAGSGVVQVRGFSSSSGATRLNGQGNATLTFNGVTNLFARVGGNGLMRVSNMILPGSASLTSFGNATIHTGRTSVADQSPFGGTPTGPLFVGGNLNVSATHIHQSDVNVTGSGRLSVFSGGTIDAWRPASSNTVVNYGQQLTVTPNGRAAIALAGLDVDGNVVVNSPSSGALDVQLSSADIGGQLSIRGGASADRINVTQTTVGVRLFVGTLAGNDVINVSATVPELAIDAGENNDQVRVSDAAIDSVIVRLGIGSDTLDLANSRLNHINARGGSGGDLFLTRGVQALDAVFYGEDGFDTFRRKSSQPNDIDSLRLVAIEKQDSIA